MKKIKYLVVLVVLVLVACSSGDKEIINMVKKATHNNYESITYGKAIGSYLRGEKWSSGYADGEEYVNVVGRMMYDNEEVEAALQFKISSDRTYFQAYALEINGVPQNMFFMYALIEDIFMEYSL